MRDTVASFRARFQEGLRDTGVTLPQLRMLKAVEGQSDSSAAAIARHCQITPQTLQSMLGRATREGWIVRGSSDRNHRFVTAELTPKGIAILALGVELRDRIQTEMWQDVPLSAMRAMREAMEAALANLERVSRSNP